MEEILRISGTVKDSVVDGPGHRFVIFTQCCHMNCEGCNRPENLDPTKGKSVSIDTLFSEIEEVKDNIVNHYKLWNAIGTNIEKIATTIEIIAIIFAWLLSFLS